MIKAGRSQVWVPIRSLIFFNLPNPFSRTMAPGFTHPLTELSIRNIPGKCGRRIRLTNPSPSVIRLFRQFRSFDVSQPYRPSRPVTGTALLFFFVLRGFRACTETGITLATITGAFLSLSLSLFYFFIFRTGMRNGLWRRLFLRAN
jgi:hypothetical protein